MEVEVNDEEVQRLLNIYDEEPAEHGGGFVVLCTLSAAVVLSILYFVWRLSHG